jgi:protein TIF31
VREHEPVVFNNNVFKNVKLVMSDEELKVEEDKVRELSKFLKEQALANLIKNMQKSEGTPTDSVSMREFFHQNGVNMRYLGILADEVKDKNLN